MAVKSGLVHWVVGSLSLFALAVQVPAHAAPRAEPACAPMALPSLGGNAIATRINDSGTIIGMSSTSVDDPTFRPVSWEQGRVVPLPELSPGVPTVPVAINRHGVIVGFAMESAIASDVLVPVPVVWVDGRIARLALEEDVDLAPDGSLAYGVGAWDINDRGEIIGDYADGRGCLRWASPKAKPERVKGIGADFCQVAAIDERGTIAGLGFEGDRKTSFLSRDGKVSVVPDPRVADAPPLDLVASHVNQRGDVLGAYGRQVFWSSPAGTRLLPYQDADVVALTAVGTAAIIYREAGTGAPRLALIDADGSVREQGHFNTGRVNHWKMSTEGPEPWAFGLNARHQLVWTEYEVTRVDGAAIFKDLRSQAYVCQLR